MEDLADLQVAAGHTVAFFGMAHPLNTHLEYASHFPVAHRARAAAADLRGRMRGVARMLYSTSASRGMDAVIADFRPDVVHLHNIYHQLSPSMLRARPQRRIPAVMTLHDYKLACPTYQFLDHGNLCQACLGGHFQHAILRRCKDGSLGSSAVMAGELFVHTITRAYSPVRVFICPSAFLEGRMRAAGSTRGACATSRTSSRPGTSRSRRRLGRVCSLRGGSRRRKASTCHPRHRQAGWGRARHRRDRTRGGIARAASLNRSLRAGCASTASWTKPRCSV